MAVAIPLPTPVSRARVAVTAAARRLVERGKAMSRVGRARAGYATGVLSTAVGVGIEFGAGWALIVGGVVTSGSYLLLYDVDERSP